MKTRSAKAKGRRLQQEVAIKLWVTYSTQYADQITPDDFRPAIMGESGVDIKMSTKAKLVCPFDIECKNVENLNLWSALKQAEANTETTRVPLLVIKRNHEKAYAVLPFDELMKILK